MPILSRILQALGCEPKPDVPINVAEILDERATAYQAQYGQAINWRQSVVDLMKALDMDSSYRHRVELAHELGYKGDQNNSGLMNQFIHRELMRCIAINRGKLGDG